MNNFTLVICTYKRSFIIKKCLEHILNNTLLPSKIIVVDQNYDYLTYNKVIDVFKKKFDNYIIIRNLIQKA